MREGRSLTIASARERASVCHALGISLALGLYPLVIAQSGTKLPFDIDIEPLFVDPAKSGVSMLARRLDEALCDLHRTTGESSMEDTARQMRRADTCKDPVELEGYIQHALSRSRRERRALLHPVWVGSYPDQKQRTCFHVMPFGRPWSNTVRDQVRRGAERAGLRYRRGDETESIQVIRSVWDEICRASCVVVDLTGMNENVCLELGLAHAIGRPLLLMSQDDVQGSLFPEIAKLQVKRYSVKRGDAGKLVERWRYS